MSTAAPGLQPDVPFYANHPDGTHCMLAAYRSVFAYFWHRELSWKELETRSGYQPGRAAWTIKILTYMAEHGFDIRMIEPFDYQRYLKEGEPYLAERYPAQQLQWYYDHSNVRDIRPFIPAFARHVAHECRQATLQDIDDMLAEGRLVFVTVNSRALHDREGFVSHALLITGKDGDAYIAHDSGPPPQSGSRIPASLLWRAMGGDQNTAEVTGFKLGQPTQEGKRLDVYVTDRLPMISRAFAAKLAADGKVLVNDQPGKPGTRLRKQDIVRIDYSPSDLATIPIINLPILYEDDDCIVINKPVGVLTHAQGKLSTEATVASFVRGKLQGLGGSRAGIVHRLDRATSGVIICAKHPDALSFLQKQFADRTVHKTYTAIARGHLQPAQAIIDMPIMRNPKAPATFRVGASGKPATTQYTVLQETPHLSLVELAPRTGRTHQLRVHLAHMHHAIVGDSLYGTGTHGDRLFLHAHRLELTLPNGAHKTFEAPLPPEFQDYLHADQ